MKGPLAPLSHAATVGFASRAILISSVIFYQYSYAANVCMNWPEPGSLSPLTWLRSLCPDCDRQHHGHATALPQLVGVDVLSGCKASRTLLPFHRAALSSQVSSPSRPDQTTEERLPFLLSREGDAFITRTSLPVPPGAPLLTAGPAL